MGAHAYCYFAPYEGDVAAALAALQEREFRAGRYDPALKSADPPTRAYRQFFPPGADFPAPGAQHGSIAEARAAAQDSGTGSILDIEGLSTSAQFVHASPASRHTLVGVFGGSTPSHNDVEQLLLRAAGEQRARVDMFWSEIRRGQCRYFLVYERGAPVEVFFAGLSVD